MTFRFLQLALRAAHAEDKVIKATERSQIKLEKAKTVSSVSHRVSSAVYGNV